MKRTLNLLLISMLTCCAGYAQQYKTNGNLFDGSAAQIAMSDKQHPTTLNGEKIYSHALLATAPQYRSKDTTLRFYILSSLKNDFSALPDGMYNLNLTDIVVDKDGRIVYSRYGGIEPAGKHKAAVPEEVQAQIETRLREILSTAPLLPAHKNAATVPFIFGSLPPATVVEVKNHNARVF